MGRPLKIKKTTTKDIGFNAWDQLTNPVYGNDFTASEFLGVVGGAHTGVATATYPVVKCRVKIGANAEADGWIIRQKGNTKYLVSDGTNTGVCVLVNKAQGALGNNEMNIAFFASDSSEILISKLTNKWAWDYSNVRYAVNFFTDESTQIKSGTTGQQNTATQQNIVGLAQIENYTS